MKKIRYISWAECIEDITENLGYKDEVCEELNLGDDDYMEDQPQHEQKNALLAVVKRKKKH